MRSTRVLGFVLLIAGIVLIISVAISPRSVADNINRLFQGRLTQNTAWYVVGGIAATLTGGLLMYRTRRGST